MARLTYLPDSNAWGRFLNGRSESLWRHFDALSSASLALCSIVLMELQHGYRKGKWSEARIAEQYDYLAQFVCLPFDERAARIAGDIWGDLGARGELIDFDDMQIAAIAIANDLIVVTHNVKHFSRVPGLRYEDWEM